MSNEERMKELLDEADAAKLAHGPESTEANIAFRAAADFAMKHGRRLIGRTSSGAPVYGVKT